MLPMLYMLIADEVVAQELGVEKMVPTAQTLDVWGGGAGAGDGFLGGGGAGGTHFWWVQGVGAG